jgi:peptide/nickel transport system substrate-binding protein
VSDSTAVSELLSGGVDISQIAGSQYTRVQHNPNIKLYKALAAGVTFLDFKANTAPWNDVAVRRAIAQAIDRQGIIKAALHGLAKPAYSPVPQNVPYYDPASPSYLPKYDPGAAQKVLSAHHVTGTYTLLTDNTPTDTTAAELIQAELSSVGVNVKIVTKASSDYISAAQKGQFDLLITSFFSPDADSFMYLLFHSSQEVSGGLNFTFYKNATLDKLILQGRTTIDPAKETRIYAQAQRIVLQNVVCDPLWTPENVYGMRPYVQGFHTDILGLWPNFQDLYLTKK